MTLFEAFRAFIRADASLAAKVGSRVYPTVLPVEEHLTSPALVIKRVSGLPHATLDGASGLNRVRIECTAWGKDVKELEQIIARLRVLTANYRGIMGGAGGVKFATTGQAGPRDIFHPESRCPGCQLDILAHVDEDTIS